MTARRSFDPCAGRSCVWGTIQNALPRGVGRFRMRSRAGWDDFECAPRSLCAYSAERLFIFRVCRGLRAAPNAIFTGGVVEENGRCSACFLRKRGAAGEASAWRKRAEPSPSSLRDATSPEGGGFALLTGRWRKAPPSGELDATNGSGLRGLGSPLGELPSEARLRGRGRLRGTNPFRLLTAFAATFPKGTASGCAAKFAFSAKASPWGELASAARLRGAPVTLPYKRAKCTLKM